MADKIEEYISDMKTNFSEEMYFKNIDVNYDRWIKNVSNKTDKQILNQLFLNTRFFSKIEIKEVLKDRINNLKSLHNNLEDAVILPLAPIDGRYSGANEIISLIKEIDVQAQFEGTRFLPYKNSIINDLNYAKDINTLIFVDDIVGTGGTLRKFISFHKEKLKNKEVIFLFLTVTKKAELEFSNLSTEFKDINFNFNYYNLLEKISDTKVLSDDEYKRLYEIEEKLWGKGNNNIMGFRQSELLVLFSHNIPNNTVGNLWYPLNEKWKKLFVRISAPNRKLQNYSNTKKGAKK